MHTNTNRWVRSFQEWQTRRDPSPDRFRRVERSCFRIPESDRNPVKGKEPIIDETRDAIERKNGKTCKAIIDDKLFYFKYLLEAQEQIISWECRTGKIFEGEIILIVELPAVSTIRRPRF